MEETPSIIIGPFQFDPTDGRLWNDHQDLRLRPKTAAILHYLVTHPGRLITRQELFRHIWPDTSVTNTTLRVRIRELRVALGDQADAPRYIETVGRRGYRFLIEPSMAKRSLPPPVLSTNTNLYVGRQDEVELLERLWVRADHGERQLVLISGEAGIGKTTLIDHFVKRIAHQDDLWIVRGHCVEQYGDGEPYLPLLEALTSLCRSPEVRLVREALRQYAPMWLLQLPESLDDTEIEALRRRVQGMSQARMLRELADVIDVITAEHGLVLVLEDLHWSDPSTLEWLHYIGQRRERARLLIIGAFRPVEAMSQGASLSRIAHELPSQSQVHTLSLPALSEDDVRVYVRQRLGPGDVPDTLIASVYRHAGGHPLFLKHVVDDLLDQEREGLANECGTIESGLADLALPVPDSLRQLLNAQIERLSPSAQQALEVASVAGQVFAVASVAAGMQCELEAAEDVCHELMQHSHLIASNGLEVWTDQTVSGCYRFQHMLYLQVAYERVGAGRSIWLHRRIGERIEKGYGSQVSDIANRLVIHFEAGGDQPKAERYRLQAAQNALRQYACQEAVWHAAKGLEHLDAVPDPGERTQHEFTLHVTLGISQIMLKGHNASEVAHHFERAWGMAHQLWASPQQFVTLYTVMLWHLHRGEVRRARDMSEQLYRWTDRAQEPVLRGLALQGMGTVATMQGDFVRARTYLMESLTASNTATSPLSPLFGHNHQSATLIYLAWTLWWLGYPEQALQRGAEAVRVAQDSANPFSIAQAQGYLSLLHLLRRETHLADATAQAGVAIAREYEIPRWDTMSTCIAGWTASVHQAPEPGMNLIRQGLNAPKTPKQDVQRPFWLSLLAEVQQRLGQTENALNTLEEALGLVDATGATCWQAELLRLKGEWLMSQDTSQDQRGEAEACFQQAIAIARRQQAKSWELRAAMSLGRLWQRQGKQTEARQQLAEVYDWFTEGFDTADLQEASSLLEAWTGS